MKERSVYPLGAYVYYARKSGKLLKEIASRIGRSNSAAQMKVGQFEADNKRLLKPLATDYGLSICKCIGGLI